MTDVDWAVLAAVCTAVGIAITSAVGVKRELRRRREASATRPVAMERHQLRIVLHRGGPAVYDQRFTTKPYPKGVSLSSDPSIRYFLKWYHGRPTSEHILFATNEDGVVMIPRNSVLRYEIERRSV